MLIGFYPGNDIVKFSSIQLRGNIFSNNICFFERIYFSLASKYTVKNFEIKSSKTRV